MPVRIRTHIPWVNKPKTESDLEPRQTSSNGFTKAEDRIIRKLYKTTTSTVIAQLLSRPRGSITARAGALGISKGRRA